MKIASQFKYLRIIGLAILFVLIFRGPIFRCFIDYQEIGIREEIGLENAILIKEITDSFTKEQPGLNEISKYSDRLTTKILNFSTQSTSHNPNELIHSKKANCMGYAAMYNSIANFLIRRYGLQEELEAKHLVGKLTFLSIDMHQFFQSSFFRDHDYNIILNKKTGQSLVVDPVVSDYLWISKVD